MVTSVAAETKKQTTNRDQNIMSTTNEAIIHHEVSRIDTRPTVINGIPYIIDRGTYAGPASNAPWRYTAILSTRPYVAGENKQADAALAAEMAKDERITAGEMYHSKPIIRVEEIISLYAEDMTARPADSDYPQTAEATHLRYIMTRRHFGDHTVASTEVKKFETLVAGMRAVWSTDPN